MWRYVYRAVDQHGQVINVLVSKQRTMPAATRFYEMMLADRDRPREATTDLAAPLLRIVDDLLPEVLHDTTKYGNNRIECDHGRLKARLQPIKQTSLKLAGQIFHETRCLCKILHPVKPIPASLRARCGLVMQYIDTNVRPAGVQQVFLMSGAVHPTFHDLLRSRLAAAEVLSPAAGPQARTFDSVASPRTVEADMSQMTGRAANFYLI